MDESAGVEVPDRHGAVVGPRDDASSVGAHRHGPHPSLVPGELVDERAGVEVPDRNGAVIEPRDDASSVGAHRHGSHEILVPRELVDESAGVEIPDRNGVVAGRRDNASSVGAHRHGSHRFLVPRELVDESARVEVPDRDGVVVGPRDDASSVGAHRHGSHPILVPGEDADQGGRFVDSPPAEQESRLGKFDQSLLGFFGEGTLSECHRSKEDLLGERIGLTFGAPIAEVMGFALDQAEHGRKGFLNAILHGRGEIAGGCEALLETVNSVAMDDVFPDRDVFERRGNSASTVVAELHGFSSGCERGGELTDQRVETHAVLEKLFDEADIVQLLQGPSQGRGMCGPARTRDAGEQAESGNRNRRSFGKLPRHSKQEPSLVVTLLQGVPLGFQRGRDGRGVDGLEIDRGQHGGFVVKRRQTAFFLEPFAVLDERDVGPLGEESTGELKGQRQPPEPATNGSWPRRAPDGVESSRTG